MNTSKIIISSGITHIKNEYFKSNLKSICMCRYKFFILRDKIIQRFFVSVRQIKIVK